jgi:8-oxo-dGTP pyrophosphatase MutT (NUDIX family)
MLDSGFASRLRAALQGREPMRERDAQARWAAVAVIITTSEPAEILFVRRVERPGDPWSGQMAFPGGFAAPEDSDLRRTAERETLEETGLDLRTAADFLGELDEVAPRTPFLPRILVAPFVYAMGSTALVSPGPEVQEAVWLGVNDLFSAARRQVFTLEHPMGQRTFDSIVIGPYTIWGLTERVLQQLARLSAP